MQGRGGDGPPLVGDVPLRVAAAAEAGGADDDEEAAGEGEGVGGGGGYRGLVAGARRAAGAVHRDGARGARHGAARGVRAVQAARRLPPPAAVGAALLHPAQGDAARARRLLGAPLRGGSAPPCSRSRSPRCARAAPRSPTRAPRSCGACSAVAVVPAPPPLARLLLPLPPPARPPRHRHRAGPPRPLPRLLRRIPQALLLPIPRRLLPNRRTNTLLPLPLPYRRHPPPPQDARRRRPHARDDTRVPIRQRLLLLQDWARGQGRCHVPQVPCREWQLL